MELTHSFTVPTSVDDAWALFMDLERVGGCFPGATVTGVSDDGFTGTVKVKLGPIALQYTGSGSFVERDDAQHRAVIEAKGKDKRGNGTAGATVTIALAPDGDGTRADVVTDLAVTGKPAQFGRGVMQDVSDKLLQAFVACIETQFGGGAAPSSTAAPSTGASATGAVAGSSGGAPGGAPPTPAAAASPVGSPVAGDGEPPAATGSPDGIPAGGERAAGVPGDGATSEAQAPTTARPSPAASEDDALDLGSAVLPVLLQRYAGYAAAAAVGLLVGWVLGRGSRR